MSDNLLKVELRESRGKGGARKLRAAGRIPGVVYGHGKEPTTVSLDPGALERAIRRSEAGLNTLFDLRVEGTDDRSERVVLLKELQREPGPGYLLHADLYEVDLAETVEVEVPIHLIGTAPGVALEGGIVDHAHRTLRVECLPRAIPDEFELDVSALNIGDSLHVRDIALPEGVELRDDPDVSVVSVAAPRVEEEPTVSEEEAAAEGEVPAEGEAPKADAEGEAKEGD